jgi:diguanylate cyclase (GGDEF)-like protein
MMAEIEASLHRRSPRPFSAALEARFQAHTGQNDPVRLARAVLAMAAVAALAACVQYVWYTGFYWSGLPVAVASGALCLVCAGLLRGRVRAVPSGLLYGTPLLAIMAVGAFAGQALPAPAQEHYEVAVLLVLALFLIQTAPSFAVTVAVCSIAALLYPAMLLFGLGINGVGLASLSGLGVFVTVAAMLLVRHNTVLRRTAFLETARHELAAAELRVMNAQLLRASHTDSLTGLVNRRHFEAEMATLRRTGTPVGVGVVLMDIDHFKKFNDAAGHLAGDTCLRAVAQAISEGLRKEDCRIARYGGEEFAALIPDISRRDLAQMGERLRQSVAARAIDHPGLAGQTVTISVGLAWRNSCEPGDVAGLLLAEADRALYAAKNAGRDCVRWLHSAESIAR